MKIAIVYKSITGNTKEIAEAIAETVTDIMSRTEVIYMGEPVSGIEAELYIIGSWTDKGMCAQEISEFLRTLRNKKIAYFGTAGFGGSKEYYESLSRRVQETIDASNEFMGSFYCQGRMPQSVRVRYEKLLAEHPEDKNRKVNIENFEKALTHPDDRDIREAKQWIQQILKR